MPNCFLGPYFLFFCVFCLLFFAVSAVIYIYDQIKPYLQGKAKLDCPNCGGSKKCPRCNGSGWEPGTPLKFALPHGFFREPCLECAWLDVDKKTGRYLSRREILERRPVNPPPWWTFITEDRSPFTEWGVARGSGICRACSGSGWIWEGEPTPLPTAVVMAIHPGDEKDWYNQGVTLHKLGQHEEAIACYDRALETAPRYAIAWVGKGCALSAQDQHAQAITCFDQALEIDPRLADTWFRKGNALWHLGQHEEAIASYDRALDIDPGLATAWLGKAMALVDLGKHAEAITCYDEALEIDPSWATAWGLKGTALYELGRYDEAVSCLDRELEIEPNDASTWGFKGAILAMTGNLIGALVCCEEALKIDPDNPKHRRAVQELQQITGLEPKPIDLLLKDLKKDLMD